MKNLKSYHWSNVNILPEYPRSIPTITNFGGASINTKFYRHHGSERQDFPHFLFQYTSSGEAHLQLGDEIHHITSGMGFLCNTHQSDMCYYYPEESTAPYNLYFWCFHGADALLMELLEKNGPIFKLPTRCPSLNYIKQFESRLNITKRKESTLHQASHMALMLIDDLINNQSATTQKAHGNHLVKQAYKILELNPTQKHTVVSLAEELKVSRVHFNRLFRQETGISPKKYIDQFRMEHAAMLLKSTMLSIKEIAFQMDYENSAHFIRTFKRFYGFTPGDYRNN